MKAGSPAGRRGLRAACLVEETVQHFSNRSGLTPEREEGLRRLLREQLLATAWGRAWMCEVARARRTWSEPLRKQPLQ